MIIRKTRRRGANATLAAAAISPNWHTTHLLGERATVETVPDNLAICNVAGSGKQGATPLRSCDSPGCGAASISLR